MSNNVTPKNTQFSNQELKARALVLAFLSLGIPFGTAKQCALIAVEEITKAIDFDWMEVQNLDREHNYWNQVKTEIENL